MFVHVPYSTATRQPNLVRVLEKLKKSGEKIEKEGKSIATIAKDIYDMLEIHIGRMRHTIEELTTTTGSD